MAFAAAFFLAWVVVAAGVVAESFDDELLPLPPEPEMIARKATSTAISAKGPKKRAGLLLVRGSMASGWYGAHAPAPRVAGGGSGGRVGEPPGGDPQRVGRRLCQAE